MGFNSGFKGLIAVLQYFYPFTLVLFYKSNQQDATI